MLTFQQFNELFVFHIYYLHYLVRIGSGGGGILTYILGGGRGWGVCRPNLRILTLFQTGHSVSLAPEIQNVFQTWDASENIRLLEKIVILLYL